MMNINYHLVIIELLRQYNFVGLTEISIYWLQLTYYIFINVIYYYTILIPALVYHINYIVKLQQTIE